jgi:hypothetical protein
VPDIRLLPPMKGIRSAVPGIRRPDLASTLHCTVQRPLFSPALK